jgi:hypothetical protein
LPGLHDVEVVVGRDVERFKNLIEHLAVLRRDANHAAELFRA